jgi:folate-binding protein YgfZ
MQAQTPPNTFVLPSGVTRLTHWGVIRLEGEDAAKFIHGQLTQDFALLGHDEARLAAFCNAKGRMQASFVGFKTRHGEVLLLCSKDLLGQTLKRLSMFVLRAKARLYDASDEYALWGLAGSAIKNIAGNQTKPWAKVELDDGLAVALYPAGTTARQLWLTSTTAAQPAGETLALELWQWGEVASGIATVTLPVFEAFVPQMLNYESVGGVNFKKGCYPGQEVVARSQFRGTLKRRMFLAHVAGPVQPADEVCVGGEPENVVGQVVQAAAHPLGGYLAQVVLQTTSADDRLQVGVQPLQLHPLPYPLLEDI